MKKILSFLSIWLFIAGITFILQKLDISEVHKLILASGTGMVAGMVLFYVNRENR